MSERITFTASDTTLVGHLHLPHGTPQGAVVLTGPLTSVKEQAVGAYASAFASRGYAALAFDHRHFGESDGAPRQYENPDHKIEDLRAAAAALKSRLPDTPLYATGICAGAGYMAGAVANEPAFDAFAGVAGFYHDADQSRAWMGAGYDEAIEAGTAAREAFEQDGNAAMIPAVAMDGDRAMPMDEAFAYYGTERGGETRYPGYKNAFAVMSKEKTTPYDAQSAARTIESPALMIHSEAALSPLLARRFFDNLAGPKQIEWVESTGQIDFYDDPQLIDIVADRVAGFFDGLRA